MKRDTNIPMLGTKNYIQCINTHLPRGSRDKIAMLVGVSKALVLKVLRGERNNREVVRAAENIILNQGASYIPLEEYLPLVYQIAQQRTHQPFSYLKKEIFPFILPGLNFSDN